MLYRLRTLSEQTPFDAATYCYAAPLLSQILLKGGIALAEEDDPLEQIAISLDVIKFHSGECKSATPAMRADTACSYSPSLRPGVPSDKDRRGSHPCDQASAKAGERRIINTYRRRPVDARECNESRDLIAIAGDPVPRGLCSDFVSPSSAGMSALRESWCTRLMRRILAIRLDRAGLVRRAVDRMSRRRRPERSFGCPCLGR